MACSVRVMHRGGSSRRRNRLNVRSAGSRRISSRFLGRRNSPHEGGARSRRARSLQEHRFPDHIQGAEMTVLSDVVLPHVKVLGSTMAYREAGNSEAPVALFL